LAANRAGEVRQRVLMLTAVGELVRREQSALHALAEPRQGLGDAFDLAHVDTDAEHGHEGLRGAIGCTLTAGI
jgi:hypothetical protein